MHTSRYQLRQLLAEYDTPPIKTYQGLDLLTGLSVLCYICYTRDHKITGVNALDTANKPYRAVAEGAGRLASHAMLDVLSIRHETHYTTIITSYAESCQSVQSPVLAEQATALLLNSAQALADAERAGVIHGNITPRRILINKDTFLIEGYGVRWCSVSDGASPPYGLAEDVRAWARTMHELLPTNMPSGVITLLEACCAEAPRDRPHAKEILDTLRHLLIVPEAEMVVHDDTIALDTSLAENGFVDISARSITSSQLLNGVSTAYDDDDDDDFLPELLTLTPLPFTATALFEEDDTPTSAEAGGHSSVNVPVIATDSPEQVGDASELEVTEFSSIQTQSLHELLDIVPDDAPLADDEQPLVADNLADDSLGIDEFVAADALPVVVSQHGDDTEAGAEIAEEVAEEAGAEIAEEVASEAVQEPVASVGWLAEGQVDGVKGFEAEDIGGKQDGDIEQLPIVTAAGLPAEAETTDYAEEDEALLDLPLTSEVSEEISLAILATVDEVDQVDEDVSLAVEADSSTTADDELRLSLTEELALVDSSSNPESPDESSSHPPDETAPLAALALDHLEVKEDADPPSDDADVLPEVENSMPTGPEPSLSHAEFTDADEGASLEIPVEQLAAAPDASQEVSPEPTETPSFHDFSVEQQMLADDDILTSTHQLDVLAEQLDSLTPIPDEREVTEEDISLPASVVQLETVETETVEAETVEASEDKAEDHEAQPDVHTAFSMTTRADAYADEMGLEQISDTRLPPEPSEPTSYSPQPPSEEAVAPNTPNTPTPPVEVLTAVPTSAGLPRPLRNAIVGVSFLLLTLLVVLGPMRAPPSPVDGVITESAQPAQPVHYIYPRFHPEGLRGVMLEVVEAPADTHYREGDVLTELIFQGMPVTLDQSGQWLLRVRYQDITSTPVRVSVPQALKRDPLVFQLPLEIVGDAQ